MGRDTFTGAMHEERDKAILQNFICHNSYGNDAGDAGGDSAGDAGGDGAKTDVRACICG